MSSAQLPRRATDTPLEMPSVARGLVALSRMLRLRCPHCGKGPVLKWNLALHERCRSCNLRYNRGDRHYFGGAMFFGVMMGELLFAVTFMLVLVSMWPNVPWDQITWMFPLGILVSAPILIPFSKVVWLTADVFVRPVVADETR
ncbi:MAG TPA: DUF983 domain-containing protein [Gemmatimonadaceae bacterium]|nr:DUF983 domain-containing protein [Gemmatimonadaceae bacterium]